jgi:hypothetical protein
MHRELRKHAVVRVGFRRAALEITRSMRGSKSNMSWKRAAEKHPR